MKVTKKKICDLNKCYSIAPLFYKGKNHFLVAAEKHDPCYLFSEEGELLEKVWDGPGGVMTMVQVPGTDGIFLATQEFYSPNDSADAKIVICQPSDSGWQVRTLCRAPFVHRFGILERAGIRYLIVCCLKSGHEYKEDWRSPGVVYAAVLPEDLSGFDGDHPLALRCIRAGLLKNHGYSQYRDGELETAIVGCENGILQFIPPSGPDGEWEIRTLTQDPSSDAVLMDFDKDGRPEIGSITPFHGDTLRFYHLNEEGRYVPEYEYPEKLEFLHATWACELLGKPSWIVGNRKGGRKSMVITREEDGYHFEVFETGCGAANAFVQENGTLILTNRETDEVAMYRFE